MKKIILTSLLMLMLGFLGGYYYKNVDLFEAASEYPRGSLDIPAQWFMMESMVGWEKMMLVFGYADNVDVCQNLVEMAKEESPARSFRCTDAN
jgi:hypothetical protein